MRTGFARFITASFIAAIVFAFTADTSAFAADSKLKEEIRKIIKENPDIVLDAIKDNSVQVFEALQEGANKKRMQDAQNARDAEFKNPHKPEIDLNRPVRGAKNAKITIVEYSDFQCPYCSRAAGTVEQVLEKYKGKVRLIYKHLPLQMHDQAMPAAKYFEAIALQGNDMAWKFHDILFSDPSMLNGGEAALDKAAKAAGADVARVKKDLNNPIIADRIGKDMAEAAKFGFNGTPGFLINGVSLRGAYPIEEFSVIIDRQLGN